MVFASSGPPGGRLGSVFGAVLGHLEGFLGGLGAILQPYWAVLEALVGGLGEILNHLGRTWRPS